MPRVTPLRIVSACVASYLFLLASWLILPSPPYSDAGDTNVYHEKTLKAGAVLTTVLDNSRLDIYMLRRIGAQPQRNGYAIDWQLIPDCETDSITLYMGKDSQVNLTELALLQTETAVEKDLQILLRGGDEDGASPPWFAFADAVLLYWDIHHEMSILDAQAVLSGPHTVQIVAGTRTFATISGIPTDGSKCDISQISVSDMSTLVPTKTYRIRHYIIVVLAPLTLTIVAIAGPLSTICFGIAYISMVVAAIYCATIWICWAICGFPPWQEWRKQYLLSRNFRRTPKKSIWGVTGPLPEEVDSEDYGQAQHEYDGPVPLTSLRSFFQSRSPLDDFLVTFSSTRWMVQPLRPQPRERITLNHDDDDVESLVPAIGEAKIIIRGQK